MIEEQPNLYYIYSGCCSEYTHFEDVIKGDTYPKTALICRKDIKHDSLEFNGKFFTLKQCDDYLKNKCILSVEFLQITDLRKILDLLTPDIIDLGLTELTKLMGANYPYCANKDNYLLIADMLMCKLKQHVDDVEKYIEKYIHNIRSYGNYQFSGVKFNNKHDTRCADYNIVDNADALVEVFQKYENVIATDVCKYCLGRVPTDTLVHPCKCKNPVHIECFTKWFEHSKKLCEICKSPFLVNELRIHSTFMGIEIEKKTFFPFDDYYPVPLFSSYGLEKANNSNNVYMAVIYLQTQRLQNLLENAAVDGTLKNMCLNNLLKLVQSGSMPSNYLNNTYNADAYETVENILTHYLDMQTGLPPFA